MIIVFDMHMLWYSPGIHKKNVSVFPSGDKSKDIYDGLVEPSALSRSAYWFHVHIMDLGLRLGKVNPNKPWLVDS